MKAVVFHGISDIRLDNVKEPAIKGGTDALVPLTASAICGTDLHMVRGTLSGMRSGTILGHEGIARILMQKQPLTDVIAAYKAFDKRETGWIKIELLPAA